jgi:hypothetical protein
MTNEKLGARGQSDKGLKGDAVTFWDGVAIGLDSTAPAYTIAAVPVDSAGGRTKAPAILLVSFMAAMRPFYYLNRADQDYGTTLPG